MATTAITLRILGTDVAIESVKQLKAEIKAAKKEMEATGDANHYAQKAQQVAQMTAEVKRLEAEQRRMNQAAIAAGSATGSYVQMNARLNELKATYKAMSEAERNSPIGKATLAELQKLDKELKKVDATMGNFQRNVGNYPRGISAFAGGVSQAVGVPDPTMLMAGGGAAVAGAAAAAALVKVTQMSVAYKEALTDVEVITGKTSEETDALVRSLADIDNNGVKITNTYVDTAKTLQSVLNVLGDSAKGNEALVKSYQEAAIVLSKTDPNLPLTESVPVLNEIMKSFNIDFGRVSDVADAVAESARLADIPVNKVAKGLVNIGDASRLAGVSMEETVAILQVTASGLGGAEEAGTKMRRVLTAMSDTKFLSKPALAALKEANVDLGIMFNTALPLSARLQELSKIQDNAGALGLVFAESNVAAAAALIRNGKAVEGTTSKIQEMTAAIKEGEANNAAYEMAATKMAGSTAEKWNTLTAKVANFFTSPIIANGINILLDGLTVLADKITGVANSPFFQASFFSTIFGPAGSFFGAFIEGYGQIETSAKKAASVQEQIVNDQVKSWKNATDEQRKELEARYLAQGENGAKLLSAIKARFVEMSAMETEAANKSIKTNAAKYAAMSEADILYYSNQIRRIAAMAYLDKDATEAKIKETVDKLKIEAKKLGEAAKPPPPIPPDAAAEKERKKAEKEQKKANEERAKEEAAAEKQIGDLRVSLIEDSEAQKRAKLELELQRDLAQIKGNAATRAELERLLRQKYAMELAKLGGQSSEFEPVPLISIQPIEESISSLRAKIQEINKEIESAPSGENYDQLVSSLSIATKMLEQAELRLELSKKNNGAPLPDITPQLIGIDAVKKAEFDRIEQTLKKQKEADAQALENKKALTDAGLNLVKQASDLIFNVQSQNNQRMAQREMEGLNRQKAAELELAGSNAAQKEFIERKYAAKEEEMRRQQFEREKKMKIQMALMNGALAVTTILAQMPKFDFGVATAIAIGLALATTAIQVATISAAKYAGGGKVAPYSGLNGRITVPANWVTDTTGRDGDNTLAYIGTDETVLNKAQADKIGPNVLAAAGVPGYTFQPKRSVPSLIPKYNHEPATVEVQNRRLDSFQSYVVGIGAAVEAVNRRIDRIQVINDPFETVAIAAQRENIIKKTTI